MTIWTVSGVFFAIWWAAAAGLLLWRRRLYLGGRDRHSWESLAHFSAAWWLVLRAPTLFAFFLLGAQWLDFADTQLLPGIAGLKGYLLLAAAVPVPQFFSAVLVCFFLVWQNRVANPLARPFRRDLFLEFLAYIRRFWSRSCWSLLFLVIAARGTDFGLRVIATIAVFVFGALGRRQLQLAAQMAVQANPVPLEDGPLKYEILRLADAANIRLKSVLVRPLREKREGTPPSEFECVLHTWQALQSIEGSRLVLPLQLVQRLDPSSITAGLAADYIDLGVYYDDPRTRRSIAPPKESLRYFAVALVLPIALIVALTIQNISAAAIIIVGIVGYLLTRAWRKRKWRASKGRARELHKAYQIWKEADPSAHRKPRDFIAGLAQFRLWTDRPLAPENWLNSFESVPGWLLFLDDVLPGGREEGREILRRIRIQQR